MQVACLEFLGLRGIEGCSLVILNHEDNSDMERFMLQMEYLADILIETEPLATGLAADVHGHFLFLCTYMEPLDVFYFSKIVDSFEHRNLQWEWEQDKQWELKELST
ncbi:hypothetical protein GH714_009362 [Hevea brasiliensis]|uniref:Uncharacterized protein n=1 Tax=Hevea brasiliensis TaxID=3981 RepID=A0A6A6MXU6_HEVBR|nr:hypothetical protein GH714_009362 [Hevea brasiliensis]